MRKLPQVGDPPPPQVHAARGRVPVGVLLTHSLPVGTLERFGRLTAKGLCDCLNAVRTFIGHRVEQASLSRDALDRDASV